MDFIRNLGTAAVSTIVQKSGLNLPFSLGDKVVYFEGKSIWSLFDATKRDDGTPVSVFVFDSNSPPRKNLFPFAKNALRKLRTVRHPDVLKFMDAVETDTTIYIMTDRVQPLGKALAAASSKSSREKEDWLVWGLHRISIALAFVNDSCISTHGNLRVDSIFISPSGEWKLGGFELLSNAKDDLAVLYTLGGVYPNSSEFASPEVKKAGWSVLKEHHPSVADGYALGLLLHSVFNPNHPLPATAQPPHLAPQPSSRGSIPKNIFPSFKRLLNPSPKTRLSPAAFLETGLAESGGEGTGFFATNRLVKICAGLDNFNLGSESDKTALLRSLKESASSLPPEFASHRVLPALVSALEFGGASASVILPLVLQMGVNVAPAEYSTVVLGPVVKLYASPDRGTRMALLDSLGEYADKIEKSVVSDKVWPHLQTGFSDTVPVIREATVKAIGLLYPKFSDRILNNDLLRYLAKMQMDTEASIRTNTCILIGRLASSLGSNTRSKVLVPAFGRALKDSFVHARVAGLMAFMATIECFDVEDLALKVIPSISFTLVDKEKLVRDQAFKAMELFIKRLEKHASTMPETALNETGQPNFVSPTALGGQGTLVNSAAGAAGALAGWAMSSLSKKLVPGDLQSTMSALSSIERANSAPPPAGAASNGRPSVSPLPSTTISSTLSSPGLPTTTRGLQPSSSSLSSSSRGKGMQLGASKVPGSFPSSLVDELANEAEADGGVEDAFDAWGSAGDGDLMGGDLMDVNADEGDWSAFEAAPLPTTTKVASASVLAPKPMAATGLGFVDLPQRNAGPSVSVTVDDPWGDIYPTATKAASRPEEDNPWSSCTQPTHPSPPILPQQQKLASAPPPRPISPCSRSTSPFSSPCSMGLIAGEFTASPTPAASASPSTVGMSKEEKAAEMARRKEERKQRIAQLKESRNKSSYNR